MKKVIAFIVSAAMLLALMPVAAFAGSDVTEVTLEASYGENFGNFIVLTPEDGEVIVQFMISSWTEEGLPEENKDVIVEDVSVFSIEDESGEASEALSLVNGVSIGEYVLKFNEGADTSCNYYIVYGGTFADSMDFNTVGVGRMLFGRGLVYDANDLGNRLYDNMGYYENILESEGVKTIWLVTDDGFTEDQCQDLSVWLVASDFEEISEELYSVTPQVREGSDPAVYDIAITIPAMESDDNIMVCFMDSSDEDNECYTIFGGAEPSSDDPSDDPFGDQITAHALYFEYDGIEYVVGLSNNYGSDSTLLINEDSWDCPFEFCGEKSETWEAEGPITFYGVAAIKEDDGSGAAYFPEEGLTVNITNVEIEHCDGDDGPVITLSDSEITTSAAISGNTFDVYARKNYREQTIVWATIQVFDGETCIFDGTDSEAMEAIGQDGRAGFLVSASWYEKNDVDRRTVEGGDTVEKLNDFLAEKAEEKTDTSYSTRYFITLDEEYEGTIVVPNTVGKELEFRFNFESDVRTTIKGGVDLSGGESGYFENIDFVSAGLDTDSAIYNGNAVVNSCSFKGYAIALDGSRNIINSNGCVFYDNEVAVLIDFGDEDHGFGWAEPSNNLFISNGTAYKIRSFSSMMQTTQYRFYRNDFISNTCDVDLDLENPGTVYMYNNYFGDAVGTIDSTWAEAYWNAVDASMDYPYPDCSGFSSIVESVPAKLSIGEGSKLIANPRWNYPVAQNRLSSGSIVFPAAIAKLMAPLMLCGASIGNFYTIDWTNETVIVNDESVLLQISAYAFKTAGDKTIEVVDTDRNGDDYTVGTWNFSGDFSNAEEDFDAGIVLAVSENGFLIIPRDSDLYTEGTVTFTVPFDACADWDSLIAEYYTDLEGDPADAEATFDPDAKTVTVTITAGGYYYVEGYVNTPEEDDSDDTTPAVVIAAPINYAEIADETFSDVNEEDWDATAIGYCAENDLFAGYPDGSFKPAETVTRAMVMTVLAKLQKAEVTAVEGEPWYKPFVDWAVEEGISDGTNPEKIITREQLVVMMWNLSGQPESNYDVSNFSDLAEVDAWALPAIRWAVKKGVIAGKTGGRIDPLGSATKAEFAQIMYNYCEKANEKTE